ncbi:MAG TPA: aldo/keto reductase, partial [Rhizomicrobium sp.]|nr:aldo/keto reductase [Rhizomicrobium sp.]
LGFGAMQITGPGVWGPPRDKAEALRVLRRLPGLGVNFIDTADSYGPDISEQLIREALYPYDGLLIATKAGFTRSGPHMWHVNCRPEHLIAQARKSCRQLGVEQIALWQLHRIDSRVPRNEQFSAVKQLLDEGLIRHAGLSEVSVEDIKAASKVFPVASVQNSYNLADRHSDDVVDYCQANGIGFIPYYPLGGDGELTRAGGALDKLAKNKGVTQGQVALAWLLRRSPVMLPIPGTSKLAHLEENMGAGAVTLTDAEFTALDRNRR